MRASFLVVALLPGGTSAAGAQAFGSPLAITANSYSDSRSSCAYGGSRLYFPELDVASRAPSTVYRVVMSGGGATVPWTIHAFPQGWDAMVAVRRQADLTPCVDFSDFDANGRSKA